MIASIQTYGDNLLRFHPHWHCLVSDGLFLLDGSFLPVPAPDPELLMRAFRHGLLKALLAREIITEQIIELLLSWHIPASPCIRANPSNPKIPQRASASPATFCTPPSPRKELFMIARPEPLLVNPKRITEI